MKYLNIGCGFTYSNLPEWVNMDFIKTGEEVIAHNLLSGIPFNDDSFELVYHSHVLEHFSKTDGEKLLLECFRVLKPKGVLRIAVPNLENIVREYLLKLESGLENPQNENIRADYNWILLELYDQTIRNKSGGEMLTYLKQEVISNEDYVLRRIGQEGKKIRESLIKPSEATQTHRNKISIQRLMKLIWYKLKYFWLDKTEMNHMVQGRFRSQGEIHQWMYDRYSLTHLLEKFGFTSITVCSFFDSYIKNWNTYLLDGENGTTRKPDSLFIEARKPG